MPRAAKRPVNAIDDPAISTDEEEKSVDNDMEDEEEVQTVTKKKSKKSTPKATRQVRQRLSAPEVDDDDEMNTSLENGMEDESEDTGYKETGQIVKIYVENFMCHKKFSKSLLHVILTMNSPLFTTIAIQFCRHVNFITGSNGSGKSAIVSAVQLCLGATAKVTGRGSSLAGFVKEGTDGPAIAQITLINEGGDAYRPEVYGKRIVIERKITRSGVSSYTTYAESNSQEKNGAVISHEKREVDSILRYFNIYVDNPCCVLTQEEAKKFIQGEDKEKYDFFLKASGLHRTKEELLAARELIHETTTNKEKCEQVLTSKIEENRKLRDELDLWINFDVEENKVKALQAKVYWAKAYVCQGKLDEQGTVMQKCEEELAVAQAELERLQEELNSRGSIDSMSAAITELQAELEEVKQVVDEKAAAMANANRRVTGIKATIAQLEGAKNDNKKRLREVEAEVTMRWL
jgi:structural maintenance of chromosomes protein 6